MSERRAEPRFLCSDLIKVRIESSGQPAELIANLEDISPSGVCLQFDRPVPPGTRLSLMLGRYKFHGRTQYCAYDEIGYFVGVRFDAGRKWSRRLYQPKHLLDPAQLMVSGSAPKSKLKTNA